MVFDIYNPYRNKDVTTVYVNIIKKMLIELGYKIRLIDKIEKCKCYDHGIVVIGIFDVIRARRWGYKKIILWIQGLEPEESFMRNQSFIRKFLLSGIEYYAIRHSSFLFFVSEEMKKHFEKKYGISVRNFYIMPCINEYLCMDSFREQNKYKKNTFVYVGGLQNWQCFNETLLLYEEVENILPNTMLYIYTRDVEDAKKLISKTKIQNIVVSFVPQNQLSNELRDKKFGFVLRRDNVVNHVATPTKLSNYLANGVIPIYTSALKDFSNIMRENTFHIELPCGSNLKEYAQKICASKLIDDQDAEAVLDEYRGLFNEYYSEAMHVKEGKKHIYTAFT